MRDPTARYVYPVLDLGLDLRDRLTAGRTPAFDPEHARLMERLMAPIPDVGPAGRDGFLGIRYALASWLDETFTRAPGWADRWNERKMEVALYGTNDRAWKFWQQARLAEQLTTDDALEVFFLCVQLGFRGNLAGTPAALAEWIGATRDRLCRLTPEPTAYDLEPDPAQDVPPRHGERRFERMLATAGAALLVVIPVTGFLLAYRAGGR